MTTSEASVDSGPRFSLFQVPAGVLLAAAWMVLCLLLILVLPLLVKLDISAISLTARLSPQVGFGGAWAHPLGTDDLGRDVLSRLVASLQTSLAIALGATVISAVIGTAIGIVAAHLGGWVNQIIVGAVDAQVSVPFIIISLTLTAIFGNNYLDGSRATDAHL